MKVVNYFGKKNDIVKINFILNFNLKYQFKNSGFKAL